MIDREFQADYDERYQFGSVHDLYQDYGLSMITLKQVADEAGVSVNTVSRVLNGKNREVWPSAIQRANHIRRVAQQLNYRPHGAARAMQSGRTGLVGVLTRNSLKEPRHHLNAYEMVVGLNLSMEAAGLATVMVRIDDVETLQDSPSRVFQEQLLDGMVVIGTIPEEVQQKVADLVPNCIWLDADRWRKHACIHQDEIHAGQTAAQHLIGNGYTELVGVGFPEPPASHYSIKDRLQGIRELADKFKRPFERKPLKFKSSKRSTSNYLEFRQSLKPYLKPHVGLIAYNNLVAEAIAHAANELGFVPGRDFGLACCSGSHGTSVSWPMLARMEIDHLKLGQAAGQMMQQMLDHPQSPPESQLLQGEWISGTTAAGPQAMEEEDSKSKQV